MNHTNIISDLILHNGNVYSVTLDGSLIRGQAIAIKKGRIQRVGSEDDVVLLAGETTKIIDCKGHTILPGMCDAHCHPSIAAASMSGADLFDVYRHPGQSAEEVIQILMDRLKQYVDKNPDKSVIRGTGWVYQNFNPAQRMPTRQDIDKVCRDKPVILESFCQHNLWVNTKAIEMAGLDASTPDTRIGRIYREENGYPQGVFNDPEAMDLIKMGVPGYDLSVEEYKKGILWYQKECANRYGVTLVQDCMHTDHARQAYRELAEEGLLNLRMRGVYHLRPAWYESDMEEILHRKGMDNIGDLFRIDTVKMFAEGAFHLIDGYIPRYCQENGLSNDYNGALYWDDDVFVTCAAKAMDAGLNIHVHAMGDGAVKQSVDCLTKAQHISGKKPRNVVAHLMLTPDETAERMGEEEILANCQPAWMMYEADVEGEIEMMGRDKAMQSYPLRKFLDHGVRVAFGTDYPVTPPPDTMQEVCVAMTRAITPGTVGYETFQGIVLGAERPATLSEAIQAITINGAYQMQAESYTGSLEEGKSADIVILDSNLETMSKEEIYRVKVEKTIFQGNVVFDCEKSDSERRIS